AAPPRSLSIIPPGSPIPTARPREPAEAFHELEREVTLVGLSAIGQRSGSVPPPPPMPGDIAAEAPPSRPLPNGPPPPPHAAARRGRGLPGGGAARPSQRGADFRRGEPPHPLQASQKRPFDIAPRCPGRTAPGGARARHGGDELRRSRAPPSRDVGRRPGVQD